MPSKKLCELARSLDSREGSPITVEIKSSSTSRKSCPLSAMRQIVKPRDLYGDQIEAWQEKQVELAAQRWIADGDAPLPREFEKVADLTGFLASVRLREVFKSERKRVDKQRRVDAVVAAIVSERRRVRLAGPTAFLFRNRRLELPQPVGLQFLTVRELLQFRAVDRSARRAGEQDHHWIPRLRAAGVTADAPGAAPVETDWDWRDIYRSLDEVRGIKNVERDRADAEAKAMAQNDPAVLAWLRAEVEKVVRPPRPGMPPDRIDHITQSITQALLDATSAESVKRRAAKDLGPSFASATLARDLCVKRGLESAWRPVARGGMRWPRTRAMDRFLEAVLYRWSHAKSGEKVALTHGRYRDKTPWSTPYAAARRASYHDSRCLEVKRGRDEFVGKTFRASCSEKNGCQCDSANYGRHPTVCLGSSALSAGRHAWWINYSTRRVFKRSRTLGSSWADIHLYVGIATTAVDRTRPLGLDGAGFGVCVERPIGACAFHDGRWLDAPYIHGGKALLALEIKEDGSATLAISSKGWADQTPRIIAEGLRLTGGPALRPAVSFCDGALVDIEPLVEPPRNLMAPGPPPGGDWWHHVQTECLCGISCLCEHESEHRDPVRMPRPRGRSG